MTFKTVLVDLSKENRAEALLEVAEQVAQMCGARLVGVFVMPQMHIVSDSAPEVQHQLALVQQARDAAARSKAKLDAVLARVTAGGEFRLIDVKADERAAALWSQGRTADLIIASQTDPAWGDAGEFDAPQQLVLATGRPVLVVPNAGSFATIGHRVLVAWNDTREAARAAFDAIALMARADEVKVVWFSPHHTSHSDDQTSTKDVVRSLWQHRINAVAAQTFSTDVGVADEMLREAEKMQADLLVMGLYGHSRTRELLLGGASRDILRKMTIPVLMSH